MTELIQLCVDLLKDLLVTKPSNDFTIVGVVSALVATVVLVLYFFKIGPMYTTYVNLAIDNDLHNRPSDIEWYKVHTYELKKMICYYIAIPTILTSLVFFVRILLAAIL